MSAGQRIVLEQEDDWWVITDEETGVTTQGRTREHALEMLDEAVELYKRESGPVSWEEEKKLLEEMGLDPEAVKAAREESSELPEFMQ